MHPNLKALDLGDARHITPKGIAHLARLGKLEDLGIDHATWNAAAFRHLEKLPLKKLRIRGATLGDDAVAALSRLGGLTHLDLIGSQKVTDQNVRRLAASLPKLKHIDLGWTRCDVQDETVVLLAGLPLRYLGLGASGRANLTDVAVGALLASKTLQRVVLPARSRITPEALASLRKSGRRVCTGRRD
ncbi:MAG: hypothetical protein OER88_03955 [Planctomycetota bacterium]|nr:hypothetical protein [Planctomycetota bacterium]